MQILYKFLDCWPYEMRTRSLNEGQDIPKNWHCTEAEAIAARDARKTEVATEYNQFKVEAVMKLDKAEDQLRRAVSDIKTMLGVNVSSSAEASDDTGLDSFIELDVTIKGKYLHSYSRHIDL